MRVSSLCLLALSACVLLSLLPSSALADTNANCTYDDFVSNGGHWDVWASEVGDKNRNCSESMDMTQQPGVKLLYPNIAVDDVGNYGNWTLIYNQGIEVWIGGRIFFALSAYNDTASFCDRSQVGWAHGFNGDNWTCFQAIKSVPSKPAIVLTEDGVSGAPASSTPAEDQTAALKTAAAKVADQQYTPDPAFIKAVNAAQSDFTVREYPEFEKLTIGELQRMRGSSVGSLRSALPPHATRKRIPKNHKPLQAPTSFDWRNVSGVNYVSPVRAQGQCGSCYAYASAAMMEARIRVKSNNAQQPIISTQDIVSCSQYSQGCEGGFPYLVGGKYGRDFGLTEEACYPYQGQDSACSPNPQPGCNSQRWFTKEYYYIGGYYGQSTVELMQEEIMANGPIAVSFEVTDAFEKYSSGVFSGCSNAAVRKMTSEYNPFHLTNHVVVIVGWGVTDANVPYWIVKNSWGPAWGENGFFRILRGVSDGGECAIESLTVSAIPILH